jgi:hypothetical protein
MNSKADFSALLHCLKDSGLTSESDEIEQFEYLDITRKLIQNIVKNEIRAGAKIRSAPLGRENSQGSAYLRDWGDGDLYVTETE